MMQAGSARRGNGAEGWLDSETEMLSVNPRATDSRISDWVEPHLVAKNPLAALQRQPLGFSRGVNELAGPSNVAVEACGKDGIPCDQFEISQLMDCRHLVPKVCRSALP